MYIDLNKTPAQNHQAMIEDLFIGGPGSLRPGEFGGGTGISSANPVSPEAQGRNTYTMITVPATGRLSGVWGGHGETRSLYYHRRAINDFVGRAGNIVFVEPTDTNITQVAARLCARLKIRPDMVTISYNPPNRLPTGDGLDTVTITLTPNPAVSSNLMINGTALAFTAVNRNPVKFPIDPQAMGNYTADYTLPEDPPGTPPYPSYVISGRTFDNRTLGDIGRTPEDTFLMWLNEFLPTSYRSLMKISSENTEIVSFGVSGDATSASRRYNDLIVVVRGKVGTNSPIPVSGVCFRYTCYNYAWAAYSGITNVPRWVFEGSTLEEFTPRFLKYWRMPRSHFNVTNYSRNATTGSITCSVMNLSPTNPAVPFMGLFGVTLTPAP